MAERTFSTVTEGLAFPECPRWHAGRLWFSDMHAGTVHVVAPGGALETVAKVPGNPAGIDWLPDGTMLVVSMRDRRLLRVDHGAVHEVADLRRFAPFHCNELVVSETGHAYVGNFGFDLDGGGEPMTTNLVCVDPDGEAWVVVDGLFFPNGMVITPTGTLIVAESFGQRLSAYDIEADGSLGNPRVWADLRPNVPDGICLDAEGGVWIADPMQKGVLRVTEGGVMSEWIPTGDLGAYACCLGGSGGRTLFVCVAATSDPERSVAQRSGRIISTTVEIPAA